MAEFKIDLPEGEMTALMTQSILAQLSPEAQQSVIAQAVAWLTTPERDWHGAKKTSPLEDAFRAAMRGATFAVVHDLIENDTEVRGFVERELRALVRDFGKTMEGDSLGELRGAMIEAMVRHLADRKAEEYR